MPGRLLFKGRFLIKAHTTIKQRHLLLKEANRSPYYSSTWQSQTGHRLCQAGSHLQSQRSTSHLLTGRSQKGQRRELEEKTVALAEGCLCSPLSQHSGWDLIKRRTWCEACSWASSSPAPTAPHPLKPVGKEGTVLLGGECCHSRLAVMRGIILLESIRKKDQIMQPELPRGCRPLQMGYTL